MPIFIPESIPVLGIALILAVIVGKTAHLLQVPKVTGFILVGVVLGPTWFNVLTPEIAESFHLINEIAFELILFNIGGEFHRTLLRRVGLKHIKYSALTVAGIFLITSFIVFLFSLFSPLSTGHKIVFSLFLGMVAIAAAPPTTLLVIKEYEAKGPLTQAIIVFLAVGTVAAITGAQSLNLLFQMVGIWQGSPLSTLQQFGLLIWSIIGSILVGTLLGLTLSFWEQKERKESELLLAVGCTLLIGQTIAYYLKLEPLLLSLFVGFSLVNSSPAGRAIHAKINGLGLSIYALFFVLAGAHIHLQKQIATIGILGVGYLVARTTAFLISAKVAARIAKEPPKIEKFLGLSVLSHAGAALAIVSTIKTETSPSAIALTTVVMASLFFFEILGPFSLKFALKATGEVNPFGNLDRVVARASLPLWLLGKNFLENVGLLKRKSELPKNSIIPLMQRDIVAIQHSARIKELVKFVDQYDLSIYPIVNEDFKYLGVMDLALFHKIVVKSQHKVSVIAKHVLKDYPALPGTVTFKTALNHFAKNGLRALPVVHAKSGKLIGILHYKELIIAMNVQPKKRIE